MRRKYSKEPVPSQWGCEHACEHSYLIFEKHGDDYLEMPERHGESVANIVAVAPQMLDMLEMLIYQGERCNWFGDRLDEQLAQQARDLISKAKGES